MVGIKPPLRKVDQQLARELWRDPKSGNDLVRIGVETAEQMSTLFVMDGKDIHRLTDGVQPLTDLYPKRLGDTQPDAKAAYEFGLSYLEHSVALERFLASPLIEEVWPSEWKNLLEPLFFVREARYRSETAGSNWLAELDFYLRESRLRAPVLAVQNSDEFRLALAEDSASHSDPPPAAVVHDLIAGALARRDFAGAISLLEGERDHGFANPNDLFLLTYLYCLNGNVEKAEALAAAKAGSIQKDWFVDWLWAELQAQFGFHPPR
jgi:hypothetical protein